MKPGDTGYAAVVYHDDPEDAATDQRSLPGPYPTALAALVDACDAMDAYWNGGGTVHRGTVERLPDDSLRINPEHEATSYVSPDGVPDVDEWPLLSEPVS